MLDGILPAIIAQPCQAANRTTKGGAVAPSSTQRIEPPISTGDLAEATARMSPIEPPISTGDLAEATAPMPPDELKEEAQLPAVSVEAVAETAGVTLRELAPWLRRLGQWLLVLLALYAVGWLLVSASAALTPFVIGLVLAYLLMPIVDRLAQRMARWLAILLVYICGIGLLV